MFSIFLYSLTFSYLALGVLYSNKIGFLNIAIEGFAFLSVFLTSLLIYFGYSAPGATLIVLFINLIFSLLLSFLVIRNYNIFIIGIGINMFFYFLVHFLMRYNFNLSSGFSLGLQNNFSYIIFFIVLFFLFLILSIYLFNFSKIKVVFELIRSDSHKEILGENKTNFFKSLAILISVLSSSIAGSFLAINLNIYSYNLGLNNGWVAICIVYIAFSNPFLVPIVSFLIVLIEYQFFGLQDYINSYFTLSFPFYFAIIINVLVSLLNKKT